jgi:hypothetical protein
MTEHPPDEHGAIVRGIRYTLRLTLGALEEIEKALGVADLQSVMYRLAEGRLTRAETIALLVIALKAGGHILADADLVDWPIEDIESLLPGLVTLLVDVFCGR